MWNCPPTSNKTIVVTAGEPAGIGVDLCLHLAAGGDRRRMVFVGDKNVFAARARQLGTVFSLPDYSPQTAAARAFYHLAAGGAVTPGAPSTKTAGHVLRQLQWATDGCLRGEFCALLTAPVCKSVLYAAGVEFVGQTEYIARRAGAPHPVMLLAGPRLRVALATTHLPLSRVAQTIGELGEEGLFQKLKTFADGLAMHFTNRRAPRILVAGLNPHAGESGYLGDEEIRHIAPAVLRAQQAGIRAEGPVPADTVFIRGQLPQVDGVLAMFHDQGLPTVKFADFKRTVNVTLGLPFLRTSPDHGIAADLVATGRAKTDSMLAALALLPS